LQVILPLSKDNARISLLFNYSRLSKFQQRCRTGPGLKIKHFHPQSNVKIYNILYFHYVKMFKNKTGPHSDITLPLNRHRQSVSGRPLSAKPYVFPAGCVDGFLPIRQQEPGGGLIDFPLPVLTC
jgi:hypothetical protein